jgi:hypothetical protein
MKTDRQSLDLYQHRQLFLDDHATEATDGVTNVLISP